MSPANCMCDTWRDYMRRECVFPGNMSVEEKVPGIFDPDEEGRVAETPQDIDARMKTLGRLTFIGDEYERFLDSLRKYQPWRLEPNREEDPIFEL
jgi:hypothetical protein